MPALSDLPMRFAKYFVQPYLDGRPAGTAEAGGLSFPILLAVLFPLFFMGMLLAMSLLLTTPVHHERYEDQGE
jgi:hypothetical protein